MYRFEIHSRELLVGWSELEYGDPPMGVAFGKFIPGPGYGAIRSIVVDPSGKDPSALCLSARLANGTKLEASGGVHIEDHSDELGESGIEVTVFGIEHPPYKDLFRSHVDAYQRQFPSSV